MTATTNITELDAIDAITGTFARNWWLLLLRGVCAILFGLLAFILPGVTILTLVLLFSAYSLVNGVLTLAAAVNAPKGTRIGSQIFAGILGLAAGVVAFLLPGVTALALVVVVGCWAIATGVMEIATAIRLRKVVAHEWLLALAGVASILFGAVLLFLPAAGALVLVWWIGGYAVAFGILMSLLAFKVRQWRASSPLRPSLA